MVNFDGYDVGRGLIGGLIIGISSTLTLLLYGNLTGLSGFLGTTLMLRVKSGLFWKVTYLSGLLSSILIAILIFGSRTRKFGDELVELYDAESESPNALVMLIGGFLVGVGTRLGNGCTSGHGVCGLPRLSYRSITAVAIFFSIALVTANTINLTGLIEVSALEKFRESMERNPTVLGSGMALLFMILVGVVSVFIEMIMAKFTDINFILLHHVLKYLLGLLFGIGLTVSGMTRPSKVRNFLVFDKNWDITLFMVLASSVGFNLLAFNLILRKRKKGPVIANEFQVGCRTEKPDIKLVSGACIFGLGWGMATFCPGPAMIAAVVTSAGLYSIIFMITGMYVFELCSFLWEKLVANDKSDSQSEEVESKEHRGSFKDSTDF